MPYFTLVFNALSLMGLFFGFTFLKLHKIKLHQLFMLFSFVCSVILVILFLEHRLSHGFYLSPALIKEKFGDSYLYFLVFLISHILAALLSGAMSLPTIYFALRKKIKSHKKTAKICFVVWTYSSISGIALYFLMI